MARADYEALGASSVGSLLTGWGPNTANTVYLTTSAMSSSTEKLTIAGDRPIDIRIDFDIHISSLYSEAVLSAGATSWVRFTTSSPINTYGSSFSELWEVTLARAGSGDPTQTGTLDVGHNLVGIEVIGIAPGSYDWQSSLSASTVLYANPSHPLVGENSVRAGAEAFNTVRTYVTVLNPANAQFVTFGSGHDYSPSPVPEPEIYALLGMGLGFVGWAARRRKQKDAATA